MTNIFIIVVITYVYCSVLIQRNQINQSQQWYKLVGYFGNLQLNFKATLTGVSWTKKKDCKYCLKDQEQQCKDSCFSKGDVMGVNCIQPYCQITEQIVNIDQIIKGSKCDIQLKINNNKEQLCLILGQKISKKYLYDGQINLLSSKVINPLYIMKNKKNHQIISLYKTDQQIKSEFIDMNPIKINIIDKKFNKFQISQIKITSNNKQHITTEQNQIPLIHTNLQFSFDIPSIKVNNKIYHKVTQIIINECFKQQKCQIANQMIQCQKRIHINSLDHINIALTINGVQIQFPISILLVHCSAKKCRILLEKGQQNMKGVIIGDILFNIFVVQYSFVGKKIYFHRLNNYWGKKYLGNVKINAKEFGFIQTLIYIIWEAFLYFLKAVFYLAIVGLLISLWVNKKAVIRWFYKVLQKLERNRSIEPEEDTQIIITKIEQFN